MAEFRLAIQTVLKHEGGLVDDPDDAGGITNWGISMRWLRRSGLTRVSLGFGTGRITKADVRRITRAQAIDIYRAYFWRDYGDVNIQALATKLLDTAVNVGHRRAHRLIQKALRAAGRPVKIDGILGPRTLAWVNSPKTDPKKLLKEFRAQQACYYARVVLSKPKKKKYLQGWMRRAVS